MKTTIDWLKFRSKLNPFDLLELVRPAFGSVGHLLEIRTGSKGRDGWKWGADIVLPDNPVAHIDYGGESQRDWVRFDMPGGGCEWVQDWSVFDAFQDRPDCDIKRIDIALTTDNPNVVNDAMVVAAHEAGKFCNGGRPPAMKSVISSDPCAGKTRYIGKRENHKFLRCYEKGWELFKDFPVCAEFLRKPGVKAVVDHYGEVNIQDLYRVELELKDVDKYIPWTVIGKRDEVFASAYPFCADLLPGVGHFVMYELPSFNPQASLITAMSNAYRAYGGVWKAAHLAYGNDDAALLRMAREMLAPEPSQRLLDSGVLTVDHVPFF